MTKKDYILLAETIKTFMLKQRGKTQTNEQFMGSFIAELSSALYSQNNRFDENKFYKACQR